MTFLRSNYLVLLMALTSGFVIMSVEMLGGRILAPYFGSSVYVWGSLIFTFMVGLSIGYGAGGKLSVKYHGLSVLVSLFVFAAIQVAVLQVVAEGVLNWTFDHTNDPRSGSLFAALVLYLLPTATLGMVSPIAIRSISSELNEVGNYAGMLYLVSTLGSALGTLITSFWWVAIYEVRTIMYINVALLLVAAAMGFGSTLLRKK